jgi:hypothetical protein
MRFILIFTTKAVQTPSNILNKCIATSEIYSNFREDLFFVNKQMRLHKMLKHLYYMSKQLVLR